jgi:lipoprotein NlpD
MSMKCSNRPCSFPCWAVSSDAWMVSTWSWAYAGGKCPSVCPMALRARTLQARDRWVFCAWLWERTPPAALRGLILLLAASGALLAGCASQTPAPVFGWDETAPAPEGHYRVKAGDTLSQVAQALKIDSAKLVLWNDLKPPYKIVSGRLLRIVPPGEGAQAPVAATTQGPTKTREGQRKASVAEGKAGSNQPKVGSTETKTKTKVGSAKTEAETKAKVGSIRTETKTKANSAKTVEDGPKGAEVKPIAVKERAGGDAGGGSALRWQWPLTGPVRQTFVRGDRTRAGIRIAGHAGDRVRAAEAGTVVYSGSGLKGYGNLIIIQHNKSYLSAYGFNRRLLVHEGEHVKRGQAIAELGQTAGEGWLLHFEIRRNGNAVDPMGHLPSVR